MRAYIMFITAVWVSAYADDVDVCHQVHLMSDYCISYGETGSGIGGSGSIQIFEEKLDIKLKGKCTIFAWMGDFETKSP